MWKALIKLLEKWSCNHKWKFLYRQPIFTDTGECAINHYNCKICGKFKKVKNY